MNGATPVGPSVLMRTSATATNADWATIGMRWNDATSDITAVVRMYWLTTPTRMASTTEVVTSGELWPHAAKRRTITSPARENESARKKIHAKHTTWNVMTRP